MAKKTHFAFVMVALSFLLGACSSANLAKAPANDKNYERTHERKTPFVTQVDRY